MKPNKPRVDPAAPVGLQFFQTHWVLFDVFTDIMHPVRAQHLKNEIPEHLRWPQHCFIPMGLYQSAIMSMLKYSPDSPEVLATAPLACAIHQWGQTRGVYRFDPDIINMLKGTTLKGDIPGALLRRLPEWCVFIELAGQGFTHWGEDMLGFFAHLEHDPNQKRDELRLLVITRAKDQQMNHYAIPVHLGGTIEEGVLAAVTVGVTAASDLGMMDLSVTLQERQQGVREAVGEVLLPTVQLCTHLVLWLCSEEPDISGRYGSPFKPAPIINRWGAQEHPVPQELKPWDVGVRYASKLRAAQERWEPAAAGTGSRKRPHTRAAHWHAFWKGPKGHQELTLKFLPPILVNADEDAGELPTVVHPVE